MSLPRYRCHKEVTAGKIAWISELHDGGAALQVITEFKEAANYPGEKTTITIHVTPEFITKHHPQVGGYFVVYADGYQSFSPAKAFEEGYHRA
jgi:hypothetical protein